MNNGGRNFVLRCWKHISRVSVEKPGYIPAFVLLAWLPLALAANADRTAFPMLLEVVEGPEAEMDRPVGRKKGFELPGGGALGTTGVKGDRTCLDMCGVENVREARGVGLLSTVLAGVAFVGSIVASIASTSARNAESIS